MHEPKGPFLIQTTKPTGMRGKETREGERTWMTSSLVMPSLGTHNLWLHLGYSLIKDMDPSRFGISCILSTSTLRVTADYIIKVSAFAILGFGAELFPAMSLLRDVQPHPQSQHSRLTNIPKVVMSNNVSSNASAFWRTKSHHVKEHHPRYAGREQTFTEAMVRALGSREGEMREFLQ